MKYTYSKIEESYLLRFAPWADLDLIREKFIKGCRNAINSSDYLYPEKGNLEKFMSGENPTMPQLYDFKIILSGVVNDLYQEQRNTDPQFTDAKNAISAYFFEKHFWKPIGDANDSATNDSATDDALDVPF